LSTLVLNTDHCEFMTISMQVGANQRAFRSQVSQKATSVTWVLAEGTR